MILTVCEEDQRLSYTVCVTSQPGTRYLVDHWRRSNDGRLLVRWDALERAHVRYRPGDPSEVREGFSLGYAWCDVQALARHRGWPPAELLDAGAFTERIEIVVPNGFFGEGGSDGSEVSRG